MIPRDCEDAKQLASRNSMNEIVLGAYDGLTLKRGTPGLLLLKCYIPQLIAIAQAFSETEALVADLNET